MSLPPTNTLNHARTRMVHQLRHNSPFLGCRFDPSGRYLFASAQDFSIQRWDLNNSNRKVALAGHRSWVRGLAFVTSGAQHTLISSDYQGKLMWWPVAAANPRPARTVNAHRGWIRAVSVSRDNRFIASCGNDRLVKIWNAANGTLVRTLRGHESHVYNVAFHPRQNFLISADHRGVIKQWDYTTGRQTRSLDAGVLHRYDRTFRAIIGGVRSMAFNADGSQLACAGITDVTNAFAGVGKPAVVLFNFTTGRRQQLLRPRRNFRGTAWGVDFHSTGFLAGACGGSGGRLCFWRSNNAQAFAEINLPNVARDLHMHRDGRRLALAFYDNSVRIYDMRG